jgi:hypothetical protein
VSGLIVRQYPAVKNEEVDFNETINWPKHNIAPDAAIIWELEAAVVIARAMSKFTAVYNGGPSEWEQFLTWGADKGYFTKLLS